MDLLELARLQSGTKAVDSAAVNIALVFVPGTVNLVEVASGEPSHAQGWLLAKQLRKESIFGGVVSGAIDRCYLEAYICRPNANLAREAKG